MQHGHARLALVAALLFLVTAPAGAQDESTAVVTDAVQVTDNPAWVRGHSSPTIALNPKNGELVIVETDVYAGFGINVHLSDNGGRTWARGGDPMQKPFTWNSDYAINGPYFTSVFDKDGVLYVAFTAANPADTAINRADRPRPVFLAKSPDGGRTFTTSMVYQAEPANIRTINNRRAMVTVDPKNPANVYVAWIQSSPGEKSRGLIAGSADGGRTFRYHQDLAEAEPQGWVPAPARRRARRRGARHLPGGRVRAAGAGRHACSRGAHPGHLLPAVDRRRPDLDAAGEDRRR